MKKNNFKKIFTFSNYILFIVKGTQKYDFRQDKGFNTT